MQLIMSDFELFDPLVSVSQVLSKLQACTFIPCSDSMLCCEAYVR